MTTTLADLGTTRTHPAPVVDINGHTNRPNPAHLAHRVDVFTRTITTHMQTALDAISESETPGAAWVDDHNIDGNRDDLVEYLARQVTDGRVGLVLLGGPYQVEYIDVTDWVNVRVVKALVDEWLIRRTDGSWTSMTDADFKATYTPTP